MTIVHNVIIRKTFGGKVIEQDDRIRLLTVVAGADKINLHFTPIEYVIVKLLLEHIQISDAQLAQHINNVRPLRGNSARVLLRHINNIRGQLRAADLDVLRIHQFGYMLNELPPI
jgi:DNA-binding response OmpR family regulator